MVPVVGVISVTVPIVAVVALIACAVAAAMDTVVVPMAIIPMIHAVG